MRVWSLSFRAFACDARVCVSACFCVGLKQGDCVLEGRRWRGDTSWPRTCRAVPPPNARKPTFAPEGEEDHYGLDGDVFSDWGNFSAGGVLQLLYYGIIGLLRNAGGLGTPLLRLYPW